MSLEDPIQEEWRPVVGYDGLYEVSSLGRVRSLNRTITYPSRWGTQSSRLAKGTLLKPKRIKDNYLSVCLGDGSGSVYYAHVAHLVAAAFIGPRPSGQQVCHNDGNNQNNTVVNLRYDTPSGNCADRRRHGTHLHGENCSHAKLTAVAVREIRARGNSVPLRVMAEKFGVSRETIYAVRARRIWKDL